jgi:hypothetical protein
MKMLLSLAFLALAAAPLAGCHSCEGQARFWSVRDAATNRTSYTVDTIGTPLDSGKVDQKFVDEQGRFCSVQQPTISSISEQQYRSGTSGADYSINYCPIMKQCWAMPREK